MATTAMAATETRRETVQTGFLLKIDCGHSNVDSAASDDKIDVSFVTTDGTSAETDRSIASSEISWARATANTLIDVSNMTFDKAKSMTPTSSFSSGAEYAKCSGGTEAVYGIISSGALDHILVETTGSDALLIDQMIVYKLRVDLVEEEWMDNACKANDGSDKQCLQKEVEWDFTETKLKQWGGPDGKGYCMSTKANADIAGRYVDTKGCNKAAKFSVSSGNVTVQTPGEGTYKPAGFLSTIPVTKTGKLSAGFTDEYVIPGEATSMVVFVNGIAVLDSLDLVKTYASGSDVNACFKLWGTFLDTEYGNVACD